MDEKVTQVVFGRLHYIGVAVLLTAAVFAALLLCLTLPAPPLAAAQLVAVNQTDVPTSGSIVFVTPTQSSMFVLGVTSVRATVLTANGQPAKSEPVTFTLLGSGTLSPVYQTTSHHDGTARTTFTASVTAGAVRIRATALGVTGEATITVTAGAAAQIALTAQPATLVANGAATATLRAAVRDAYGNPKGGQNVIFAAAGGTLQPGPASTDARGLITWTFVAGTTARTAVVTATAGAASSTVSITLTAGAASQVALSATPPQIVADGVSTSTITALVQDAGNNPVADVFVVFQRTAGAFISEVDGIAVALTSPDGRASVVLRSSIQVQTSTVTAIIANANPASVPVVFSAEIPHTLTLHIQPNRIEANGIATATVAVTVLDRFNNLNVNTPVTLTTTAGTFPGGGQSVVAATNGAGVASTVLRAGTAVTVATVTARAGDRQIIRQVELVPGPPATLTVTAFPTTLVANGVQTATIAVIVTDQLAHRVAGAPVGFAAALGTVAPAVAATGPNGRATVVFTAGTAIGQAVVTATVAGLTSPVTLTLVVEAPTSLTLAVTPQYLRVGASANVTAEVRDRYANPVAGAPVLFSAPDVLGRFVDPARAGAAPAHSVTVNTGVNGAAHALLATTGVGAGTVTATAAVLQQGIDIVVDNALVMLPIIQRKDPPPPPPLPMLANGNFEAGPGVGWAQAWPAGTQDEIVIACAAISDPIVRAGCGGIYLAWLGGRRVVVQMEIYQTTSALPAVYTAQVKFRYLTFSDRSECNRDYARVLANDVEIRRYSLCSTQDTNAWTADLVNLANFSGQAITLKFNIVLSGGRLGNFFVDDVALCSDSDLAPDGTPSCAGTQVQADIMAVDLAEAETAGAAVRPDESAPQETPETVDGADQSGVDRLLPVDSDAGSQPSPPDANEQDNSSDE